MTHTWIPHALATPAAVALLKGRALIEAGPRRSIRRGEWYALRDGLAMDCRSIGVTATPLKPAPEPYVGSCIGCGLPGCPQCGDKTKPRTMGAT